MQTTSANKNAGFLNIIELCAPVPVIAAFAFMYH